MRSAFRLLHAAVPLVLLTLFVVWSASQAGSYVATWNGILNVLHALAPVYGQPEAHSISLYQVNDAVRKVAHFLIGLLAIVACNRTLNVATRLPAVHRIAISALLSLSVIGIGAWVRFESPDRHVRWAQFTASVTGIGMGVVAVSVAALDVWILGVMKNEACKTEKLTADFKGDTDDSADVEDI